MVSPGRRIAHRTPARYETVMVPKTVMVAPEGVQYEDIPPQYATVQRTQMVAPARTVVVPVRPRCGNCGWYYERQLLICRRQAGREPPDRLSFSLERFSTANRKSIAVRPAAWSRRAVDTMSK